MINIVPPSASFKNLTTLEVWNCQRLMNLVTSSTAKSLVCLTKLRTDGCKMLTEIISKEEDVAEDEIVFSKLKWASLEHLENLTSFSSGNYILKFPSLADLFVIVSQDEDFFSQSYIHRGYERYDKIGDWIKGGGRGISIQPYSSYIIIGYEFTFLWIVEFFLRTW